MMRLISLRQIVSCAALLMSVGLLARADASSHPRPDDAKTRLAIVGLDHDHVWGLLKNIASEPGAELVAIADSRPALVERAKTLVSPGVKFYTDYVKMLDETKPEAVIVTTENDKHLEILRECAKRHIHYSTEKPMATTGADAREMQRLADQAGIKVMVNYWNAWVAPTQEIHHRVEAGEVGPVRKMIVRYGHQGPKEIGVSKYFADWLYDPVKNGGGAIMDFGCYGAEWALWLKGRPTRVYATAQELKTEQHNKVDDDATIVLEYPDATVIIEASWDWPYDNGQVEVFGPKGSLLATGEALFYRTANDDTSKIALEGQRIAVRPARRETSNPVSYFVDSIRHNKPIEDPLSPRLNVQVMEILDAARESVRSGRAEALH